MFTHPTIAAQLVADRQARFLAEAEADRLARACRTDDERISLVDRVMTRIRATRSHIGLDARVETR